MVRVRLFSAVVLVSLVVGTMVAAGGSASATASQEAEFVSKINAERRERGLKALSSQSDLVSIARRHSKRMAEENRLYHNPDLSKEVKGNWRVLGENVGGGFTVDDLHQAFMDSSGHRRNILDSRFNQVGIGIFTDSDGYIWVTEVFAQRSGGSEASKPSSGGSKKKKSEQTRKPSQDTQDKGASKPAPSTEPQPSQRPSQQAEPQPQTPARTVSMLVTLIGLDS